MNFFRPLISTVLFVSLAPAVSAQEVAIDLADAIDISNMFTGEPEVSRLRYSSEINLAAALEEFDVSGENVRVTIMGEMVDPTHPQISDAVVKQYNTFASPGAVIPGDGNAPFRAEFLGTGDGHGTHIAGTIAAACDGVGVQGVACDAELDVYSLGAYDGSANFLINPDEQQDEVGGFLNAFIAALDDLVRRGESRITTGSFNIEAPAVVFEDEALVSLDTFSQVEQLMDLPLDEMLEKGLYLSLTPSDRQMLARVIRANAGDKALAAMALLSHSEIMLQVAEAVSGYQATDAVYIVTESNYRFENRSSVLNALPSLFPNVDPDLWLSVVMVSPEGFEEAETEEEMNATMNAPYVASLNGCGEMAMDYCISVPSYEVFSTMTQRVRDEDLPLFMLDGDTYQVFSGHSMGAPMVAATLALMEEYNVREGLGYSMKEMVSIIKQSANRDFPGYSEVEHGAGMLDVSAAIEALRGERSSN